MPNTKAGGLKFIQTMTIKHGTYENYKEHMKRIAANGGSKGAKDGVVKGFALSGKAVEAGRKGGKVGKRGKAKVAV